eukprot:ANDGO_05933.mRNA.1 putative WD repeat-containing protein C3H5.08c
MISSNHHSLFESDSDEDEQFEDAIEGDMGHISISILTSPDPLPNKLVLSAHANHTGQSSISCLTPFPLRDPSIDSASSGVCRVAIPDSPAIEESPLPVDPSLPPFQPSSSSVAGAASLSAAVAAANYKSAVISSSSVSSSGNETSDAAAEFRQSSIRRESSDRISRRQMEAAIVEETLRELTLPELDSERSFSVSAADMHAHAHADAGVRAGVRAGDDDDDDEEEEEEDHEFEHADRAMRDRNFSPFGPDSRGEARIVEEEGYPIPSSPDPSPVGLHPMYRRFSMRGNPLHPRHVSNVEDNGGSRSRRSSFGPAAMRNRDSSNSSTIGRAESPRLRSLSRSQSPSSGMHSGTSGSSLRKTGDRDFRGTLPSPVRPSAAAQFASQSAANTPQLSGKQIQGHDSSGATPSGAAPPSATGLLGEEEQQQTGSAFLCGGCLFKGTGSAEPKDIPFSPSHPHGFAYQISLPPQGWNVRTSSNIKNSEREFKDVVLIQALPGHAGSIWAAKFSHTGKYLATGGQDGIVRVWKIHRGAITPQSSSANAGLAAGGGSMPPQSFAPDSSKDQWETKSASSSSTTTHSQAAAEKRKLVKEIPLKQWTGHTGDIFCLDWSPSNFVISGSMDRTVRLWHISRDACLWMFKHDDFVTGVAFHPLNEKMFFSVSLDERLRLWNIPGKKVLHWLDTKNFLTSLSVMMTPASQVQHGTSPILIMTGSFEGTWSLFVCKEAEDSFGFRALTRIDVIRTSKRRKWWKRIRRPWRRELDDDQESASPTLDKPKRSGAPPPKITGFSVSPDGDKVLVSTNDSRIRLFNINDFSCGCKYRGYINKRSQLVGGFSQNGTYIVSGSDDGKVYIWRSSPNPAVAGHRKDLNKHYEAFVATCNLPTLQPVATNTPTSHVLPSSSASTASAASSSSATAAAAAKSKHIFAASSDPSGKKAGPAHALGGSASSGSSARSVTIGYPISEEKIVLQAIPPVDDGPTCALTNAMFVPFRSDSSKNALILTTDVRGEIRVFENRTRC